MSIKDALRIIGYENSEANIMEYLLEKGEASVEEIIKETKLSRGTVYNGLSNLIDLNRINKSGGRPVIYYLSSTIKDNIIDDVKEQYNIILNKLTHISDVSIENIHLDIYRVFENSGFALRNFKASRDLDKRLSEYFPIPEIIADAEYSIAIFVIGKDKIIDSDAPSFVHAERIRYILRTLNCITGFIFISPDRKDSKILYKKLSDEISGKDRKSPFVSSYSLIEGIENNAFYIFEINDDLEQEIINSIREIRQRYMLVRDLIFNLREKIELNQELYHLSQEHIRYVESFLSTMNPFPASDILQRGIKEIIEPIQSMTNRESRNLWIFRRKFSEIEVRINQYIDNIESRRYLPLIETLEKDISELSQIESKFKPIEYELNYIRQGIFKYAMELSETDEIILLPKINPFLFTVPYERIPFYANQNIIEKAAHEIAISINDNLPNFFQILCGDAGIGKTHALKYIYNKIMDENNIKCIYVECPVNYDLLSGVFQELTQESIYPKEVVQSVRNLRRITPNATRDYLRVFSEISDIWKKLGYSGVLIILDELENSLPYVFRTNSQIKTPVDDIYRLPIALRQLREIFKYDTFIDNFGFIVSCRSRIRDTLKAAIDIENINEFIYEPEKLNPKEFLEIIEHRYETWNIYNPVFNDESIKEISKNTNKNVRNVIKYCRALYEFSKRNDIDTITKDVVESIGPIPLFSF